MSKHSIVLLFIMVMLLSATALIAQSSGAETPVISEADGYVTIPNAAVLPEKNRIYRAIFDATQAAE